MNKAIECIFFIVVSSFIIPFIFGIHKLLEYILFKRSRKKVFLIMYTIVVLIIIGALLFAIVYAGNYLSQSKLGKYICVIIYTILMAINAADFFAKTFYQNREISITNKTTAFKNGFTFMSSNFIVAHLPIKLLINIFYLICIIVAQMFSLGLIGNNGFVSFCQFNEYGILVYLAVKEIFEVYAKKQEKTRLDIVADVLDKDIMKN
ncbi:MAG: hypothetical protein E7380_06980 [Clostridiales bacterium]|nr:hypothetical protein [Clostridiales bacterium]